MTIDWQPIMSRLCERERFSQPLREEITPMSKVRAFHLVS